MAESFQVPRFVYRNSAPDWIIATSVDEARRITIDVFGYEPSDDQDEVGDYEKLDPETPLTVRVIGCDIIKMLQRMKSVGVDLNAVEVTKEMRGTEAIKGGFQNANGGIKATCEQWSKLGVGLLCSESF